MKLFTEKGVNTALVLLAVELRRLAWTGLAFAGVLLGADHQVATFMVAAVVWVVAQALAFVMVAKANGGSDTS